MKFCTKVLIAVSILTLTIPFAKADEIVVHTVSKHTGSYDYNNDNYGIGFKSDSGITLGAYKHSYTDEGVLKGVALYVNKEVLAKGKFDLSVAVTYGYPERLKGNYKGFMAIPSVGVTQKLTDGWSVQVRSVPGGLVGGDNAYSLLFTKEIK